MWAGNRTLRQPGQSDNADVQERLAGRNAAFVSLVNALYSFPAERVLLLIKKFAQINFLARCASG
jgi:hypothetical protein